MDRSSDAAGGSVPPTGGDFGGSLAIVGMIASQAVLITAVLYYFGWVRTNSFLSYFGIDPSMTGFGTTDYVLRSIMVAFKPFIGAVTIAWVFYVIHHLLMTPTLEEAESRFTPSSASPAPAFTGPATSRRAQSALVRALHRTQALARWLLRLLGVWRV